MKISKNTGRVKNSFYCEPSENLSKLCGACRWAINPWDCIQLILPITNRLNEVNDPELTLIAVSSCEISTEKTWICLHYGTVFQTALLSKGIFIKDNNKNEKICTRYFLISECVGGDRYCCHCWNPKYHLSPAIILLVYNFYHPIMSFNHLEPPGSYV